MNIVYKCAATPKFLVVLRHCMALFFGWSPMQDTNERRIRSFNFRGRRGSTHGLSSALQVMNMLRRQDLNANFYQTVLTDTKAVFSCKNDAKSVCEK